MDKGAQTLIGSAILLVCLTLSPLGGCRREKGPFVSFPSPDGQFECDIPSDWVKSKAEVKAWPLNIHSPDEVNELPADIHVFVADKNSRMTREEMEKRIKILSEMNASDPDFAMEPLTPVRVGKYSGLMHSMIDSRVSFRGNEVPYESYPAVPYKETAIYFDVPDGQVLIVYKAPIVLYKKYQPAFERLLKTYVRVNYFGRLYRRLISAIRAKFS